MENETIVQTLNELLAHESQSMLPRLGESTVFVSWASADEQQIVGRMIEEARENGARLVDAIRELGGEPLPVLADIQSTALHFLDLSHVLPAILNDCKRLLNLYESAAGQLGSSPLAGSVITEIIERHRKHVDQLAGLTERAASPTN